jgi:DNA-binding transcriptional MerR regulator
MGLLQVAETLLPGRYRLYEREKTLARIQQIKSIAEQNRTLEDIREELARSIAG